MCALSVGAINTDGRSGVELCVEDEERVDQDAIAPLPCLADTVQLEEETATIRARELGGAQQHSLLGNVHPQVVLEKKSQTIIILLLVESNLFEGRE